MFHFNTERVIGYWRSLRAGGVLPSRQAFDPMQVASLLPQIFMLDLGAAALPFRLVGESLIDLHGRPLRGVDFQSLFTAPGRSMAARAIASALQDWEPVVLDAEGYTDEGRSLSLEILLAPLADITGSRIERLVGLYQPTSPVANLGGRPLTRLDARLAVHAAARGTHLKLAALDGRRIA